MSKTIAAGIIAIAAVNGISCVPASAQVLADGGSSHSRSRFWQHNRNRNWNGEENEELNHIRARVHNRNNDIAVARARPGAREVNNNAAAATCIDSAVQGNRKFVGVTRNGQVLIQEVTLTPTPTPSFWQNATGAFTASFPGFTPVCATLTVMGNNLHVSAIDANGRVLQTACTVNPPPTTFPQACGTPIDLGIATAPASLSGRAPRRPLGTSRGVSGHRARTTSPRLAAQPL